jgi:transcriptional regulator with XRE-family HTH domain
MAPKAETDLARAERIRSSRKQLNWNQSDLARALKVTPQTVQHWEKGGGVRTQMQAKLAKTLQVKPEFLMFGQPQSPNPETDNLTSEEQLLLLAYRALSSA